MAVAARTICALLLPKAGRDRRICWAPAKPLER
jgi:hypothetical protein